MATVKIDSGELPSAEGKRGHELSLVLRHWAMIADGRFEYDCRALLQMINEVDRFRLWEYYQDGFYKTRDEFLEKVVLIDFDLAEQSLKEIVSRLRGGETVTLPKLGKHGGDRKSKEAKQDQVTNSHLKTSKLGPDSRERLLGRLERDHKDTFFAALNRGEFRSPHAAAIAAGIIKVKAPIEQLRSWWAKATKEERAVFRKEIQ